MPTAGRLIDNEMANTMIFFRDCIGPSRFMKWFSMGPMLAQ